jgi:peptidoglycan/LPS O-acetylase OafA/YrhL
MGKISYSVYLCHFFVVNFVHYGMLRINSLLPGRPVTAYLIAKPLGLAVVFLAILAISIPPCMFTWRFVEQPGIRFGKRWIARREQAAALFRTRET